MDMNAPYELERETGGPYSRTVTSNKRAARSKVPSKPGTGWVKRRLRPVPHVTGRRIPPIRRAAIGGAEAGMDEKRQRRDPGSSMDQQAGGAAQTGAPAAFDADVNVQ